MALPHRYSAARFLLAAGLVFAVATAAWPFLPRAYESSAVLILQPNSSEEQAEPAQAMRQPLDESAILSELDTLRSTALADAVIEAHALDEDPEFAGDADPLSESISGLLRPLTEILPKSWSDTIPTDGAAGVSVPDGAGRVELRRELWEHMLIDRDRRSYTVRVGFRSSDPAKAMALTSTLVRTYMDMQVARKEKDLKARRTLLENRVGELRQRAEASAMAVADFMIRSGLIDGGAQTSLEVELTTLSTILAQAQARAIDARMRVDGLEAMRAAGMLASAPDVLASPTMQALIQRVAERRFRPNVPMSELRGLDAQLAAEAERILANARFEADHWAQQQRHIEDEIKVISDRLELRRRSQLELEQLRREESNDAAVLNEALTGLKRLTASAEALRPNAEIISPATFPDKPAFPSLPLYLAGVLGAAVLAGSAFNARPILQDARRVLHA